MVQWLDTKEAARYVKLHHDTLRRRRREGTGPRYSRIGRLIRYHIDALNDWLLSHESKSEKEVQS